MTVSLATLLATTTRDQFTDSVLAVANSIGLSTTSWRSGDPGRTIIASLCEQFYAFSVIVARIASGGFLSSATGDWLTLKALEDYDVTREEAESGTGTLTVTNGTVGSLGPYDPGELTFAHETTGKTYRNVATETLTVGSNSVDIIADEVGTDSNAAPDTITEMVTSLGALVTCTNATSLVGIDEETDADLVIRCLLKPQSLSPNGPADAYESIARSTPDTNVTRVLVSASSATGQVSVTLAGPSGEVPGGEVTLIDDAIQATLANSTATVEVASAVGVAIPVTVSVWLRTTANLTDGEVETLVEDALTAFFPTAPIGGYVITPPVGKIYKDQLLAIAKGASPYIFHATMAAPAGDTTLAEDEVATLGAVTVVVTQVP